MEEQNKGADILKNVGNGLQSIGCFLMLIPIVAILLVIMYVIIAS